MVKFENARHNLLYNKNIIIDNPSTVDCITAVHSFLFFLQEFTKHLEIYLELYAEYKVNKKNESSCNCFSFSSWSAILLPLQALLPFQSFQEFKLQCKLLINYKSSEFTQSLAITIAITLASLLFIYPPFNSYFKLGYDSIFHLLVFFKIICVLDIGHH